jgi:hypothetical protein
MSTLVVFAEVADGFIDSSGGSFAAARNGSGTLTASTAATGFTCGNWNDSGTRHVYEAFFSFDTSALTSVATVTEAIFSVVGFSDSSTQDFIINLYMYDWGATLTTADFRDGATLLAGTYVVAATHSTSTAGWGIGTYNDFIDVGGNTLGGSVNKTGVTRVMICSNNVAINAAPALNIPEFITGFAADSAGTSADPKLTITYTMPWSPQTIII